MAEEITLENVAVEQASQGERLDQVCRGIVRIETCLVGTGDDNPGLVVKLDRLTQSEKKRTKFFWLGMSAVIALIAERCIS